MAEKIKIDRETIDDTIKRFDEQEKEKESVLKKAFSEPSNKDLEVVLTKVTLLNAFYSTQLPNNKIESDKDRKYSVDILSMAKHIQSCTGFDKFLYSSDREKQLEAYNYIAFGNSDYKDKEKNSSAESFASKYCSWHRPDEFPIMDSYSRGMLYGIVNQEKIDVDNLTKNSLKKYEIFCSVFCIVKNYINKKTGQNYTTKDFDKYLWKYGKDNGIRAND